MKRRLLLLGIVLAVMLVAGVASISASSYSGTIVFACDGFGDPSNTDVILDRDNTGYTEENWSITVTDGLGNIIYFQDNSYSNLGTWAFPTFLSYDTPPLANPITMTLVSEAGNGYLTPQTFGVQQGNCNLLPLPEVPAGTTIDTCPVLPEGAVVGDLPFETQAYYAPGKVAPDVMISVGTYWVLGVDESGEYYKIRLSCDYLWVPVGSMQPNFQEPWNGQPLPTEVVS